MSKTKVRFWWFCSDGILWILFSCLVGFLAASLMKAIGLSTTWIVAVAIIAIVAFLIYAAVIILKAIVPNAVAEMANDQAPTGKDKGEG